MLMKEKIRDSIKQALNRSGLDFSESDLSGIQIEYPEPQFGDYSTNAALILAKRIGKKPADLAKLIIEKLGDSDYEASIAGPGFINLRIKDGVLSEFLKETVKKFLGDKKKKSKDKILVEYFQPNIAKPLHIGHLRTAIIGDCIKRLLFYTGHHAESETHMGDWGTQFGFLILAYKKYGDRDSIEKDPINELNKLYIQINNEAEMDATIREAAKAEFVKLEQGDQENRKIWKLFVDWSMEKFLKIEHFLDILPFDHHWPESFYEDKMPAVLKKLKDKGLLLESQGAQIVDLENQGLGIAIIVKSDGATTYLLRDLATFIHRKQQGFTKQLYVVDTRQSHTLAQTYAILKLMGEMEENEAVHLNYGFVSFKGSVLSTRKGNLVLAEEVLDEAKQRITKIIKDKNPDLNKKDEAIEVIAKGAVKYFDLKHNRHSDFEFDWEEALDFQGNSGPYLQYTYTRLASILRNASVVIPDSDPESKTMKLDSRFRGNDKAIITETERRIMVELIKFNEVVDTSLKDYLPNILANYLHHLAGLLNRFYHESPVISETDKDVKNNRLVLVDSAAKILAKGLDLLGIKVLEEM